MNKKIDVVIIIGSKSDLSIMEDCCNILSRLQINYKLYISSAHRTLEEVQQIVRNCNTNGVKVIISAAGGAAHLPGVVAALTTIPVIGIPCNSNLMGIDSLLSIVQMPKGVPVATVGVNASGNAALLAARIIATSSSDVDKKLVEYFKEQTNDVNIKCAEFLGIDVTEYINGLNDGKLPG